MLLLLQSLSINLLNFILMNADQLDILTGDVSIEVLHISETLLMTVHELVDVHVLPLLNFMDLHLQPQVELLSQFLQFLFIGGDEPFLLLI